MAGGIETGAVASGVVQDGFLWFSLLFFALAVVASIVGLRGTAGMSMRVARLFVLIFLAVAVVSLFL